MWFPFLQMTSSLICNQFNLKQFFKPAYIPVLYDRNHCIRSNRPNFNILAFWSKLNQTTIDYTPTTMNRRLTWLIKLSIYSSNFITLTLRSNYGFNYSPPISNHQNFRLNLIQIYLALHIKTYFISNHSLNSTSIFYLIEPHMLRIYFVHLFHNCIIIGQQTLCD